MPSYLSSSIFLLLAFLIILIFNFNASHPSFKFHHLFSATVNTFLLSGVTEGHGQREIYWHADGVLTAR